MTCLQSSLGVARLIGQTALNSTQVRHSLAQANCQSGNALCSTAAAFKLHQYSQTVPKECWGCRATKFDNLHFQESTFLASKLRRREIVRLQATGQVSGQVWKKKGNPEEERVESGAQASTSDQYGDQDEEFWEAKTEEETSRFVQTQAGASQTESLSSQANRRSWEVLGSVCVAVAVGVTCYSVWEKAEYERLLQRRSMATTGVPLPLLRAPQDWTSWQVLPLCLALLISLLCKRPQTVRTVLPKATLQGGQDTSALALRLHRLEEEFDSGIKTVRFLARQLEKLGVRFRLSRRTLRDPIRENTDNIEAIKAELQIVNARLLRVEEGLHEAQQIMLAMQEQQAKQFGVLVAALPKFAAAQRQVSPKATGVKQSLGKPDSKPSNADQIKSGISSTAKAVQRKAGAKAGQILGSIRVPYVGNPDKPMAKAEKPDPWKDDVNTTSYSNGWSSEPRAAKDSASNKGAVQIGIARPGPSFSEGKLVGTDAEPLKVLNALDAESLVRGVEVPERYIEDKARFEAFKNSLVDRKIDMPEGFR